VWTRDLVPLAHNAAKLNSAPKDIISAPRVGPGDLVGDSANKTWLYATLPAISLFWPLVSRRSSFTNFPFLSFRPDRSEALPRGENIPQRRSLTIGSLSAPLKIDDRSSIDVLPVGDATSATTNHM